MTSPPNRPSLDPSGYPLPSSRSSLSHSFSSSHSLPTDLLTDHDDPWATSATSVSTGSSTNARITTPNKRIRSDSGPLRPVPGSIAKTASYNVTAGSPSAGFPSHPLSRGSFTSSSPTRRKGKAKADNLMDDNHDEPDEDDLHDGAETDMASVLERKKRLHMEKALAELHHRGRGRDPAKELAIWAKLVESSGGRDKLLKCVQYTARSYLYLLNLVLSLSSSVRIQTLLSLVLLRFRGSASSTKPSSWKQRTTKDIAHVAKLNGLVSGLSLARKCLLLFNPLLPLSHLLSPAPLTGPQFGNHILSLLSGLADDVHCLSKFGIVSVRRGKWAQGWANRLWLLRTLIDLSKLHSTVLPLFPGPSSPKTLSAYALDDDPLRRKREKEVEDAEWTARKLYCDLVFSSYDVFSWTFLKEPIQCFLGLSAGLISTSKIYDKQASLLSG